MQIKIFDSAHATFSHNPSKHMFLFVVMPRDEEIAVNDSSSAAIARCCLFTSMQTCCRPVAFLVDTRQR